MKYKVSEATIYDQDEQLYATKVGRDIQGKPLDYTVWAETREKSRQKARDLVDLLIANQ